MTEDYRSDKFFLSVRDSHNKFDYFILALLGALLAYLSQHFNPDRLGINSGTLELISLLLIVGSTVAGFFRIERMLKFSTINAYYLRAMEEHGLIFNTFDGKNEIKHDQTGEVLKSDDVPKRLKDIRETCNGYLNSMRVEEDVATRLYYVRNWLLLAGFLCLISAKVWASYGVAHIQNGATHQSPTPCPICQPMHSPKHPQLPRSTSASPASPTLTPPKPWMRRPEIQKQSPQAARIT